MPKRADTAGPIGIPTAELAYFSKRGQLIWSEPRGLAAGYNWPQYSLHRGRLQMLLLEEVRNRLGPNAVRTGHSLSGFDQSAGEVVAHFADPHTGAAVITARGEALIGADGIHSVVRHTFYPHEGEPKPSGRILWRSTTEGDLFLTGRSMKMAGRADQKFVCYPICREITSRGRLLVNWIAELNLSRKGGEKASLPKRDWNRRGDKQAFAPSFADWRFDWLDIPGLIARGGNVYEFPMVDRDPLDRWSFDRVTLLGDAAHPIYPIGSNGASQAILDADSLADCLANHGITPEAPTEYESGRRPATAAIVQSNRGMGPEIVMQIVEARAPQGFTNLDDVITLEERESIARAYKLTAGFDHDTLNLKSATPR